MNLSGPSTSRSLKKTLLSEKPKPFSLTVSVSILLLCAIISQLYWNDLRWNSLLAASGAQVFKDQEYWRLFTTVFVHGDLGHLLSNAYMLGILGYFVHAYFGFRFYPFVSVFFAGVTNALALLTYAPEIRLVGASGMVYFLAGFWLIMFLLIERQRSLGGRILRILGVGLLILFPTTFKPEVSYITHAIGCAVGVVVAFIYFFLFQNELRQHEVWSEEIILSEDPSSENLI